MGKFISFDIMQGGRYLCTMHMPHCPAFKLTWQELKSFVEAKRPSLRNKEYEIYL